MKRKYLISLSISILVLAGGIVQIADAQNRTVLNEAQRISGDQFTLVTRTPKGAYVYALKQPTAEMLAAIDRGLGSRFEVARNNRYRSRLKYRDYTIYIAKADREKDASGAYSPDIAVGAAQYTGTGYDKGGYIYAAGIVVALNPCAFMIAEHTKNLDRVANAVRYEGEHLVLYHNDRSRYLTTADHSKGGGHPILQ